MRAPEGCWASSLPLREQRGRGGAVRKTLWVRCDLDGRVGSEGIIIDTLAATATATAAATTAAALLVLVVSTDDGVIGVLGVMSRLLSALGSSHLLAGGRGLITRLALGFSKRRLSVRYRLLFFRCLDDFHRETTVRATALCSLCTARDQFGQFALLTMLAVIE